MGEVVPTWTHSDPDIRHLPYRDRLLVSAKDVRDWARREGIPVRERGHLPEALAAQFNRAHRFVRYESKNPKCQSKA